MPIDPFQEYRDSPFAPARSAFTITPHSTDNLPVATKALYVGSGGDLALRTVDGDQDIVFANVASGQILPVRVRAVRSAGTTASNIVGLA